MIISPPEKTYKLNFAGPLLVGIFAAIACLVAVASWDGKPEPVSLAFAVVLTGATIWYAVANSKGGLSLHSEGLQYRTPFISREIHWSVVTETKFGQMAKNQAAAVHFGLIGMLIFHLMKKKGKGTNQRLTLVGNDSSKLTFGAVRKVEDAIRDVLAHVNPRLRQDFGKRLRAGEVLKFGDFALSTQGIAYKDKPPVQVQTLEKCLIEGPNLAIKSVGKVLNATVNTTKVPNVFVFLDLVDELRSGGTSADKDPMVRAAGE